MSVYNKNNKFASYLIILITFFILILFTKGEIFKVQENIDLKNTNLADLNNKKKELHKLNNLKKELSSSLNMIGKYDITIKEDEIIDYIFSEIEETNRKNGVVLIKNIIVSDPKNTEMGFKVTNISLSLVVPSEEKLKKILLFLTSPNSKYNFYIDSFTYPYGKINGSFTVNIPLKVLYR